MKKKTVAKKKRNNVAMGVANVLVTFNNTIVTFGDPQGDVIAWASAGASGFKGSRKSMPYAAQITAKKAAEKAMACGMKTVWVSIKGPGAGRESAVRAIAEAGINITAIKDVTPVPHNGCRPPKRRRV